MRSHITGLCEGLIAIGMWTDIGLAASVIIEVCLEVMFLGKGLGAQGATERLDPRVQAMMKRHVAAIREGFATNRTLIRLLATVSPHVLLEQHLPGKSLATFNAFVRLDTRMNTHMHVERDTLIKGLWTVRTLIFLAIAMNLHVTAEVAFVIKGLATFRALGGKLLCPTMHGQMIFIIA